MLNYFCKSSGKGGEEVAGKCYRCHDKPAGHTDAIEFAYEGFRFILSKYGMECADCARKEAIERLERHRDFVSLETGGEVRVDWEHYGRVVSERRSENRCDDMVLLLKTLGLLTADHDQAWMVLGGGIPNTLGRAVPLYFVRGKDAQEYAKAMLSEASYEVIFWQGHGRLEK